MDLDASNSHKVHDDFWRRSMVLEAVCDDFTTFRGERSWMVEACGRDSLLP